MHCIRGGVFRVVCMQTGSQHPQATPGPRALALLDDVVPHASGFQDGDRASSVGHRVPREAARHRTVGLRDM